jgi:hypothetical protein
MPNDRTADRRVEERNPALCRVFLVALRRFIDNGPVRAVGLGAPVLTLLDPKARRDGNAPLRIAPFGPTRRSSGRGEALLVCC